MALRETARDRLFDAFAQSDATVQGGEPALLLSVAATEAASVGTLAVPQATALTKLFDAAVQTDATLGGGAPALRVVFV